MRFVLLPGQRHDTVGVPPLIEGVAFDALLGDKAFDVDWIRADLDARGAAAVIPPKANRGGPARIKVYPKLVRVDGFVTEQGAEGHTLNQRR